MAQLFGRRWRVVAGTPGEQAIEVTDLRVVFKIERHHKPEPNAASVEVYNLGQASRARLSSAIEKGLKASIEAGYPGAYPLIFDGKIARVWHRRNGPDWVSHLEAADGARELGEARISQSFRAGASMADVFRGITDKLGVGVGNALEQFQSGNFKRGMNAFVEGVVIKGTGTDVLEEMMAKAGLEYSVQHGQLVVTRPGEPLAGQAVVLSRDTGLVGSPEPGEKGLLRCKALIRPGLDPPRQIQLQSVSASGLYRIDRTVYDGDSHGGNWYADLDLRRVA